MTEIRYYPLVDCDTDGGEKVAMIPTLDGTAIMAQSDLWLEEIVPSYFRLRCHCGRSPGNAVTIHCPRCGKPLKRMGENINETTLALYVCGDCGAYYGAKVWHSTDQYRRTVWQCNDKFKGEHRCTTPHLTEEQIQTLFLRSFSKVHSMRDSILEDCLLVQRERFDCTELGARQATLAEEMELAAELVRRCVEENSLKVQDQMEYLQRYVQRYEKLKKKYDALDAEKQRRKEQHDRLGAFIATLQIQTDLPVQFEPDLWLAAVEKATVYADHTVVFTFKGGMEITEEM